MLSPQLNCARLHLQGMKTVTRLGEDAQVLSIAHLLGRIVQLTSLLQILNTVTCLAKGSAIGNPAFMRGRRTWGAAI